jgi:hypothetical protein
MKTLSRFVSKFTSLIVAVLSCFDRVIFKGHLALAAPCELEYFVDHVLKVRRSDFMKTMAPQYSDRLVAHARNWAEKAGRNYVYRTVSVRDSQGGRKRPRFPGGVSVRDSQEGWCAHQHGFAPTGRTVLRGTIRAIAP